MARHPDEGRLTDNVLAALPKSAHPGAKKALAEIYNAEDRAHAIAAAKITDDLDVLLAF